MSDIAVGARRRRRKPPWKLIFLALLLAFDIVLFALVTFLLWNGYVNPLTIGMLCLGLFHLPPSWWAFKRELERWRRGD